MTSGGSGNQGVHPSTSRRNPPLRGYYEGKLIERLNRWNGMILSAWSKRLVQTQAAEVLA